MHSVLGIVLSAFVFTVETLKIMILPFRDKEIETQLLETSYPVISGRSSQSAPPPHTCQHHWHYLEIWYDCKFSGSTRTY